ncbi:uncharacterized protein PADG_11730 [Paracoccidioides brasiliensis Pb18]|uniref:Uncharacterized protein n=1 Tax=Paracoccidioides brasiliensis (strain Pb18) TaxID=502780 RepID=A0A0A0HUA5_PARBD|nr:uncharacterized protein PADG_11730 [Paracoccidioides brasiliensis Pb18]KGM92192.1 hypothetical protein PADG_11730 [Paracoccidioides brasiliensis Pb18]
MLRHQSHAVGGRDKTYIHGRKRRKQSDEGASYPFHVQAEQSAGGWRERTTALSWTVCWEDNNDDEKLANQSWRWWKRLLTITGQPLTTSPWIIEAHFGKRKALMGAG